MNKFLTHAQTVRNQRDDTSRDGTSGSTAGTKPVWMKPAGRSQRDKTSWDENSFYCYVSRKKAPATGHLGRARLMTPANFNELPLISITCGHLQLIAVGATNRWKPEILLARPAQPARLARLTHSTRPPARPTRPSSGRAHGV
jgi:hypothetical protein